VSRAQRVLEGEQDPEREDRRSEQDRRRSRACPRRARRWRCCASATVPSKQAEAGAHQREAGAAAAAARVPVADLGGHDDRDRGQSSSPNATATIRVSCARMPPGRAGGRLAAHPVALGATSRLAVVVPRRATKYAGTAPGGEDPDPERRRPGRRRRLGDGPAGAGVLARARPS
jgi:hypothetical protein